MKEKIKKIMIGYLPGFITGLIICGTISVIAATYFPSNQTTYDNTASGLESTNVQDAIDELYGVCFPPSAGDQIIEDGGLEKDPYECRYFFTGANPNNYITFNNEKAGWRIVSVECDGTIKIMSNGNLNPNKYMLWDENGRNNWANSSLMTYVNSNYYNSLTETAKKQMVTYEWSTGAVVENNNDLAGQISDENSRKWRGNIALPTLSEYLRTNSLSNCKTFYSYSSYDVGYSNICGDTTWMAIEDYPWWTLTPNASTSDYVFDVAAYAVIGDNHVDNRYADHFGVRPVLYLSSNVKITGGTGTQSDPYIIE